MIADQRLTTRRFGHRVLIPAGEVKRVAETILKSDMLQGTSHESAWSITVILPPPAGPL